MPSAAHLVLVMLATAAAITGQATPANERVTTWPDGSPKERYTVDAQRQKHGQLEQWAANGTRTLFEVYAHGQLHGAHREWTDTGAPVCALNFQNDQLSGLGETFHANGQVASSGSYRDGKRTGKWTETDPSGERRRIAEYKDGQLHGTLRILQKTRVLTRQTWKRGVLVELDDITPFPVPLESLLTQLRGILATPLVADPADAKAALRQQALLRLRTYRQLCSLPQADMLLWPAWNDLCDAAAEVCRRNGKIDHHPEQPSGFEEARYRQGQEGASHSNLATGGSVVDSVDNYMDDSDPSNLDRLGHRRWCLNPAMKKVAFGTDEHFHAMWSMDSSGNAPKGLDAVLYPPRGYVPVDLFSPQRAFSIAPLRGNTPKASELRASIRPLDADYLPGEPLELDDTHVAAGGFGSGACIVFRAKDLRVAVGSRYLVVVSLDGGKTDAYRYVVEFCEPVGDSTK